MTGINPYQGDVTRLSDAELLALKAELEEEYCINCCCGEYCCKPTDDDADAQHRRLRSEYWRRHPEREAKLILPSELAKLLLHGLESSLTFNTDYAFGDKKVGDAIQIRKPYRFVVKA